MHSKYKLSLKTSIHIKAKPKHVLNGDQIYSSREQVKFLFKTSLDGI